MTNTEKDLLDALWEIATAPMCWKTRKATVEDLVKIARQAITKYNVG